MCYTLLILFKHYHFVIISYPEPIKFAQKGLKKQQEDKRIKIYIKVQELSHVLIKILSLLSLLLVYATQEQLKYNKIKEP